MWILAGMLGAMMAGVALAGFVGGAEADDLSQEDDCGDDCDAVEESVVTGGGPLDLILTETIEGGSGDDILAGGDANQLLDGLGGDDQIHGYGGSDSVLGGDGNDDLHGGDGGDVLSGGVGNDTLHGDDGGDRLAGDDGDDLLYGYLQDDLLRGGDGDDTAHGGMGNDSLEGQAGADALHGGLGNDDLAGGDGNDTLFGGWGDDALTGSDDETTDYLNGGGGSDIIDFGSFDIVSGGTEADQLRAAVGTEGAALMDFDVTEDTLLLIYDDSSGGAPSLQLQQDQGNPDDLAVLLDGTQVALLHGVSDGSQADIRVVPQSTTA